MVDYSTQSSKQVEIPVDPMQPTTEPDEKELLNEPSTKIEIKTDDSGLGTKYHTVNTVSKEFDMR